MINWQNVSIPLYGGVDTKTDEALVSTQKLLKLENGVFSVKDRRNKRTAITKRNGYDQKISSGDIQSIASAKKQLLSFDGQKGYSFSESTGENVDTGFIEVLKTTQLDLNRPSTTADAPDSVATNGVRADICISNGDSVLRFIDQETGSVIKQYDGITATAINHKLYACGNYIFWFYVESNELIFNLFNSNDVSSILLTQSVSATLSAPLYDVSGDTQKIVVSWPESGGINVAYYTKIGVQGSPIVNGLPAPVTLAYVVGTNATWIAVRYLENTSFGDLTYLVWIEDSVDIIAGSLLENFTTSLTPLSIFTGSGNDPVRSITFTWNGDQSIHIFYDTGPSVGNVSGVAFFWIDLLGNVIGGPVPEWALGCQVASKSFVLNGMPHVAVYRTDGSTVQNTIYVLYNDGNDRNNRFQAAKINYGIAGSLTAYSSQRDGTTALRVLPEAQIIGTTANFPVLFTTKIGEQNEELRTFTGTQLVTLDSDFQDSYINAPLGKSLFMGGGFLHEYDSKKWVEAGFHYFPVVNNESVTHPGGNIESGNYLYYAIYVWINESGEIQRSGASIPLSVTVGNNNSIVEVDVTTMTISEKTRYSPITIELYRSLKNPPANAPAYKVAELENDETVYTVTLTDDQADATIENNEILYTTGGVLDNIAPSGGNLVDSYKTRLVMNDPFDSNLTWISREYVPGQSVNFSDLLTFRTNDIGGPITGYKQLDDKLLIFKENLIFFTSGQGPNNTGTDFGLFPPELVASDTGCDNASSIVLTPVGVMFKSAKGFYMMNRSLQLEYIGYDVEIYNYQSVTAATMVEDRNQVRFLTDAGLTIVYDYLYNQWSTFTNHEGKDAVMWNGVYTYLRNDGAVWAENDGSYLDFNTSFRLKIVTPWIKANGPQDYFRVRRFALLGRYASRHILQVGLSYDYRPDVQQTYYFDTQERLTGPAGQYGNDAFYGETTPYGGDDGADVVYQFRARTARQKCESVQLTIEDIPQPTNGQSYGITDLSLELGLKSGINKLGARKTVRSSNGG